MSDSTDRPADGATAPGAMPHDVPDDAMPNEPAGGAPAPVSRRQALRVLGAVPVAAALGTAALGTAAFAQQGQSTNPQAPRTPQPPGGPAARHFFTATEWHTVGVLADDVLPRDARGPSATEAGVPAFMDYHLALPESGDDTRTAMRGGLAWLDAESRRRFGVAYAAAAAEQRHRILDDVAFADRAAPEMRRGAAFFARFRDMTASGYFSSAAGWKDLRYLGNVFNPDWRGCPQPALDKLGVSYAVMDTRVAPQ